MLKEYYSRLFLPDGASESEVKIAYKNHVRKFHLDKNLENIEYSEEFKSIQEAYNELMKYFYKIRQKENEKHENEIRASKKYRNHTKFAQATDNDDTASGSKFAEVVEENGSSNDILYNMTMYFLIFSFAFCSVYAIIVKFKSLF